MPGIERRAGGGYVPHYAGFGFEMKIAIIAAEISPWAKEGGLGDVIGALPLALKKIGADPVLILPGYRSLLSEFKPDTVAEVVDTQFGHGAEAFSVLHTEGPSGIPIYLVGHTGFFDRPGIYHEHGKAYNDNVMRYIFFGRAAASIAANHVHPDVVHAHDWHAASATIAMRADEKIHAALRDAISVFTIHNLAFQGVFDPVDYPLLGINWSWYTVDGLEFFDHVNLMKGAVLMSDAVGTVSPTYAAEATSDPDFGFGLEGVLRNKGAMFRGILNGADYLEWNPAIDKMIAATYTPSRLAGKSACKTDLLKTVKLQPIEGVPLVGMVSRMTSQKGFDLLRDAFERIMHLDLQIVMLANGDASFEAYFREAQRRHPDKFRLLGEFDNLLAHKIQAGCDTFLMPSRFEPCGLTQMYAMKYGAPPVARATGGLRDTIIDFEAKTGKGNGFVFEPYRAEDLLLALGKMIATFRNRDAWRKLMANCFAADFSWERSARTYMDWFEQLHRKRRAKEAARPD
ncbi:MAG TPA: glycogen/starch synthase [Candidatus Binataceae bacterium]|nr:glycogen/starch synthase [Candidatus Binataceae bacterium]